MTGKIDQLDEAIVLHITGFIDREELKCRFESLGVPVDDGYSDYEIGQKGGYIHERIEGGKRRTFDVD